MSNAASANTTAICVVVSDTGGRGVLGTLQLQQGTLDGPTTIVGTLRGLQPGKHGMAVAINGDVSQGSASCGPIFNPFGKTHGAPTDQMRQVGDLGNILADETGTAVVDEQVQVPLLGPHSVIGRSIIVCVGEDDRGRGGHELSLTTGNAGPRVAAGVIGIKV